MADKRIEIPTLDQEKGSKLGLRARVCFVCGVNTKSYHLNYGVSTCLGCRAFFRRSVQQNKGKTYPCKNSSECNVDGESRKKCRKCRFQRCLNAGMNPECVLNDDQKKKRFKRSLKRQRAGKKYQTEKQHNEILLKGISTKELDPIEDNTTEQKLSPKLLFKKRFIKQYEQEVSAASMNFPSKRDKTSLENEVREAWEQALKMVPCMALVKDCFVQFHMNESTVMRPAFHFALCHSKDLFYSFSQNLESFRMLSANDQGALLESNTSKFLALITSMYFLETKSVDQLRWLFREELSFPKHYDPVTLFDYQLLGSDTVYRDIRNLLQQFSSYGVKYEHIHVLAASCLFHVEPSLTVHMLEINSISKFFKDVSSISSWTAKVNNNLQDNLSELAFVLVDRFFVGSFVANNVRTNPEFIVDDEIWLNEASSLLMDGMCNIPVDKSVLNELLHFCITSTQLPEPLINTLFDLFKGKFLALFNLPQLKREFSADILYQCLEPSLPGAFCATLGHILSRNNFMGSLSTFLSLQERLYLREKIRAGVTSVGPLMLNKVDQTSFVVLNDRVVQFQFDRIPRHAFFKDRQLFLGMLLRVLSCQLILKHPESTIARFCEKFFLKCSHRFEQVTNLSFTYFQDSLASLKLSYVVSIAKNQNICTQ
ncbi:hypothetical protein TCAL_05376 [Tigriopus californicus]|uniref:Nuclear receptor domain-containing protein n=1 Tax=Tigriopus californicus TaxID=6832 RepID=A0A553NPK6_TIGCA|nr:ecdysone receptor-like [Tigriopus californicus]TRY67381.1 hypothetical protein TCAL_05376 [Tigriopus californicus]|eukprot:TCALIF_05376-PA protein Name:"Similar to EcR Ecdysone receptor (Manduca sexta)" AED:0.23 eAED:0.24 QI:0/-1/0/1/-1/1/1/0/653